MKNAYIAAMDRLYTICMWVAGLAMLTMTLIIPFNVFMRYVMDSSQSWPEPMAVVIMILFTFTAGAVCYRSNMHISVMLLVNLTQGSHRRALGIVTELVMVTFNLFVLYYGIGLVEATWHDFLAEFTAVRVGLIYMTIPFGAAVTLLFIIERIWTGAFFPHAADEDPSSAD